MIIVKEHFLLDFIIGIISKSPLQLHNLLRLLVPEHRLKRWKLDGIDVLSLSTVENILHYFDIFGELGEPEEVKTGCVEVSLNEVS